MEWSDPVVEGAGLDRNGSTLLVVGGAVLAVVGAVLPWLTFPGTESTTSVSGVGLFPVPSPVFNGLVCAAVAMVVAVLTLVGSGRVLTRSLTGGSGAFVGFTAVVYLLELPVTSGIALATARGQPGLGVPVTLVAGVSILAGGVGMGTD